MVTEVLCALGPIYGYLVVRLMFIGRGSQSINVLFYACLQQGDISRVQTAYCEHVDSVSHV